MHTRSLQLCLTLCDPMDCSPPGSSVHGILQARILEWVDLPSSRESSQPRDQTCIPYVPCTGRYILHHWCHLVSLTTVHLILKLYMPGGPDINTNTLLAKRRQEEREGIPWRSSGLTPCFHCRNAGDMGSIPGWGTNIPHVT